MRKISPIQAVALAVLLSFPLISQAQEAKVLRSAWEALSEGERESVRANYVVLVADPENFGLVIDAQGVDQSTPGSNAGSVVGGAIGSVGYLDHALKSGNSYSPARHLAFGLLGALIGSAANSDPVARYQFRYALRMSDGEVVTRDVVQSDPFRHSAGMCLDLSSVSPVSKAMCGQTPDEIRAKYMKPAMAAKATAEPEIPATVENKPELSVGVIEPKTEEKVTCKLKDQVPVLAMRQQCEILGGSVI